MDFFKAIDEEIIRQIVDRSLNVDPQEVRESMWKNERKTTIGLYISDGSEIVSTDFEGEMERIGMIPPLSGQTYIRQR